MRVLCPKEMACALGVSTRTVTRLLRNGEIEGFKVGSKLWRSTDLDVESYMVRRKLSLRKTIETRERPPVEAAA